MTVEEILAEMAHIHLEKPPENLPRTCLKCGNKNLLKPLEKFIWRLTEYGIYHRTVHCRSCGQVYDVEWTRK